MQWSGSGAVAGTIQYGYSAIQNNGQITQATDGVSGETIAYQYDALRRLTSAAATPYTVGSVAHGVDSNLPVLMASGNLTAEGAERNDYAGSQ